MPFAQRRLPSKDRRSGDLHLPERKNSNDRMRNRTSVVTIPNEIDPFTGRSATCVDKMIVCTERWRRVWSQVLDEWCTSVVV